MTKEEAYHKVAQCIDEFFEFVDLVASMRAAQIDYNIADGRISYFEETKEFIPEEIQKDFASKARAVVDAEDIVDKFLNKLGY